MSTELATIDGEVIEARAPMTLFGTDDPQAVVERATNVATALADVLKQRHLVKRIGNREYVLLEGWTLLGSMLGVFAQVEWTRPIEGGWEARAVVRTMHGAVVGSSEAMCTRSERTWSSRDDYAIRSMSQTRALAKALRMPLGFIVELAGYAATPADEMPQESEVGLPDIPEQQRPGQIPLSALRTRVIERAAEHDIPREVLDDLVDSAYAGSLFGQLTPEQLIELGTDITHGKYDVPFDAGSPDERVGGSTVLGGSPAITPGQPTLEDVLKASGGTLVDEQPAAIPPAAGESAAGEPDTPQAADAIAERVNRAKAKAEAAK